MGARRAAEAQLVAGRGSVVGNSRSAAMSSGCSIDRQRREIAPTRTRKDRIWWQDVNKKEHRHAHPQGNYADPCSNSLMIVATYNVNGVNGRLPLLLKWLAEAKPDILCLQELKAPQERFPIDAIRQAACSAIWHGQKSWNGVAILSRGAAPVETRRGLSVIPMMWRAATLSVSGSDSLAPR